MLEEDTFASVAWDTPAGEESLIPKVSGSNHHPGKSSEAEDVESNYRSNSPTQEDGVKIETNEPGYYGPPSGSSSNSLRRRRSTGEVGSDEGQGQPRKKGFLEVEVKSPVRELEGTKDTFVSYLVTAKTDLPSFQSSNPTARRRFQDFVFLHDHLVKDFPATVVPPLPDKSRLSDRFSPDFVERRRNGLERFLQRLARHPTLSRAKLLRCFIESSQWNVDMHTHLAHPPIPEAPTSLLEMASDTLLNAFSKVRKPDERFVEIREGLERFEERLSAIERIEGRSRIRISDLANDYEELAAAIQGLGFLESGITDPLSRFESALLDYSIGLRDLNTTTSTPLLNRLVSLINYSDSFRGVLKLRDQKQLDFEDLSTYLSNITTERDRIAAGYGGLGIGSYLKEKMELLRGSEADTSREAKIHRLDTKIKDLQEAVTAAHETSDAFNDEVLREHTTFQSGKRQELKELLTELADGNIAMYKKSVQDWESMIPYFERIRVDT